MAQKLGQIFLLLTYPLKKIFTWLGRHLILPIYQILHTIKKKLLAPQLLGQNKFLNFFTNKYSVSLILIIIFSTIIFNNFAIQTVAAEDLGKKSLLYRIAQGDEFEELIEETNLLEESAENFDATAAPSDSDIKSLKLSDTSLLKNEPGAGSLATSTLSETTLAQGLAAEALQKGGSPATRSLPQPRQEISEYTVQSGDTISTIAEKFNISINTVLWANDLSGLNIIRPGDKLTIPPVSGVIHKIKSGDTISTLAQKYDVAQQEILSFNQLVSNDQLSVGQILIIPGGEITTSYSASPGSGYANVYKPPSGQTNADGFIWPTTSRHITQYYHWRHQAIDIGGQTGSPLYASMAGTIIKADWGTGYGYHVIINHGAGKKTLYGHMSKIYIKVGEKVDQGTVIGALGSTGWSTGPHLHFEIIINGTKVNPLSYL